MAFFRTWRKIVMAISAEEKDNTKPNTDYLPSNNAKVAPLNETQSKEGRSPWSTAADILRQKWLDAEDKDWVYQYQTLLTREPDACQDALLNFYAVELTVNTLLFGFVSSLLFGVPDDVGQFDVGDVFWGLTVVILMLQILNIQLTGQIVFDMLKIRHDCMHEWLAMNMKYMDNVFLVTFGLWCLYPVELALIVATFSEGPRMWYGVTMFSIGTLIFLKCSQREALRSGPRRNLGKFRGEKIEKTLANAKIEVALVRERIESAADPVSVSNSSPTEGLDEMVSKLQAQNGLLEDELKRMQQEILKIQAQ